MYIERVGVQLYSLFNFGARWGWEVNANSLPLSPRERDPVPIYTGGWVGHKAGQDGCGKYVNVYVYMCV